MSLFDVYPLYDVTPIKAQDVWVYDAAPTKYLDLYGGHAVISIGHAHPKYVENLSFLKPPLSVKRLINSKRCSHPLEKFEALARTAILRAFS